LCLIWGQLRDLRASEARSANYMRPQKNVTKSYFL
jgi:hypothetical protein